MNKSMELYLRRRMCLMPEVEVKEVSPEKDYSLVSTFVRNAECYNFTFSPTALQYLVSLEDKRFLEISEEMIEIFKTFVGEGEYMTPLYPNFPKQVMDTDEATLYYNAIHYWASFGKVIPELEEETCEIPLFVNSNKLTVIDLGTKEDYLKIFTNLIGGKGILSDTDKEDITFFVNTEPEIVNYMPETIPIKENLSGVTMLFINNFGYENEVTKSLSTYYKTATDVLRLATGLSTGDLNSVSLAENCKYKSFKRAERRFLLQLLENCGMIEEDMLKYKNKWIRLGEKLHPGEYKQFKKVNTAFSKIRNNGKGIVTFNSKVQKAYEEKDVDKLIALLSKRPGEFARRLATLIRLDEKQSQKIVNAFEKVASDVATPMLLEVASHFETVSSNESDYRVFFPKGKLSKAYTIENSLTPIDKSVAESITKICHKAFVENMKEKESLGKVWIDDSLKQFVIPMKNRTASKQLNFVARGTKFKMKEDTKFAVPFIYWKQPKGERVDLDLSVVLYDKDFNSLSEITYYHLKERRFNCVHSGDEQSAPNGAIECVSLDVEQMKVNGAVYAAVVINSFTNTPFVDLPECYVGMMEKPHEFSGKAFDPKTVQHKSDLVTKAETSLTCLINVEDRTMTWADIELTSSSSLHSLNRINNVASHAGNIKRTIEYILNMHKPTVYDMAILNAEARGIDIVSEQYEADTIFSSEKVDTEALLKQRAEIREAETKALIMEEAMNLFENKEESDETTLEEIVATITERVEKERLENPLPVEKIQNVTPYDVDIIVSEFI